ncbi:MAG: flagellar export protein FliJ [Phycisphaeraceae bacterium]|nr:flagellar export protein FliJ [Phycisphaeraceae bacterium]
MARFRFKLEPVLRYRRLLEDEAQRELAKTMRRRMILQDQLKQMQETITSSKQQLGQGLIGRVDLDSIAQFARYSSQTTQRARQIINSLVTAEKQIEIAREKLLKATRDRKALELLEERHRQTWRAVMERKDAAATDEMAVQAYARQVMFG